MWFLLLTIFWCVYKFNCHFEFYYVYFLQLSSFLRWQESTNGKPPHFKRKYIDKTWFPWKHWPNPIMKKLSNSRWKNEKKWRANISWKRNNRHLKFVHTTIYLIRNCWRLLNCSPLTARSWSHGGSGHKVLLFSGCKMAVDSWADHFSELLKPAK